MSNPVLAVAAEAWVAVKFMLLKSHTINKPYTQTVLFVHSNTYSDMGAKVTCITAYQRGIKPHDFIIVTPYDYNLLTHQFIYSRPTSTQ